MLHRMWTSHHLSFLASRLLAIIAVLAQALLLLLQRKDYNHLHLQHLPFPDAMRKVFATLERRISEDPQSAGPLCSVLAQLTIVTPTELHKCRHVLKGDAVLAHTKFRCGRSSRCVRIDGPRSHADAGPQDGSSVEHGRVCGWSSQLDGEADQWR